MDLARALQVVDKAKSGDQLAQKFLTFALVAGNMLDAAEEFVRLFDDGRRSSGIVALGRMSYGNAADAKRALGVLVSVDGVTDDRLNANVLAVAL